MKLRTQILSYGLCGAVTAILVGAIGVWGGLAQSSAQNSMHTASTAALNSMDADMMHDAIRGDAMGALFASLTHNEAGMVNAQKDLHEHTLRFNKDLAEMQGKGLPPEIEKTIVETLASVKAYTDGAALLQKTALTDEVAAQALLPHFEQLFKQLEAHMEQLGASVEAVAQARTDLASATAKTTLISIAIGLLAALTTLLAGAFWLSRKMSQPMQYAADQANRIAQGDLSSPVVPEGNEETTRVLQSIADLQTNFANIVRDVRTNAETVSNASAEISQGNNDLSARTEQQASALEQTAASMEELGSTVRQSADNAKQANQLAMGASTVAIHGGEVVSRVVSTMKGINESSKKISDIISVIDGIAFQTNILALNAAVEAARAGEQGRGFAVVASEVRSLARRSAEAAKEIKTLISTSVDRVEEGSVLVDQAGVTMTEVVSAIRRVTDIMGEISAASNEQSLGVAQVGEAVTQMDKTTQQNAALVEQSAASAEGLKHQAAQLVQSVAVFRL
ncbi:MAG: methyl-accepting chemotaxis protein [Aquabacterium sp.]|nr:methyl-accepting chemotaxis protein [Aquabacterium sp.]